MRPKQSMISFLLIALFIGQAYAADTKRVSIEEYLRNPVLLTLKVEHELLQIKKDKAKLRQEQIKTLILGLEGYLNQEKDVFVGSLLSVSNNEYINEIVKSQTGMAIDEFAKFCLNEYDNIFWSKKSLNSFCESCNGAGYHPCKKCGGYGKNETGICNSCQGYGQTICSSCNGKGFTNNNNAENRYKNHINKAIEKIEKVLAASKYLYNGGIDYFTSSGFAKIVNIETPNN